MILIIALAIFIAVIASILFFKTEVPVSFLVVDKIAEELNPKPIKKAKSTKSPTKVVKIPKKVKKTK